MASNPRLLSPRQLEVLSLVSHGKSSKEIGGILGIAERTVEGRIVLAIRKLGAANRAHAVAIAFRNKLIE